MHDFIAKGSTLYCEDCRINDIAGEIGTPVYVYSAKTIADHFSKIKTAFAGHPTEICYSVKANTSRAVLSILASLGSGVVLALSLPLVVQPLSLREIDPAGRLETLAWFGLVPALWALERAGRARTAFAIGLVAGLGYFFSAIHWVSHAMTAFGGLSLGVSLVALSLLVLYMAVHWAAAFAISWKIRDGLGWPMPVHLPVVWAALELCRNYLLTGFPWANLGYTQARTLAIAQLAAIAGVYAVAALVVLVNAALAEALAARREGRPLPRRALAVAAALVAVAWVHGTFRLRAVRARARAAPAITVGIVSPTWTSR